jgi:hypothetical protein
MTLTSEDLQILESFRLERFRQFFAESLMLATLSLTFDNRLLIICNQVAADQLLDDPLVLRYFAWIVTAADAIAIYNATDQPPIYEASLQGLQAELERLALENLTVEISLETNSPVQGETGMTTATLEKPIAAETQPTTKTEPQPLRTIEEIANDLATVTGRSASELQQEILNLNPPIYQFGGQFLVSPDIADAAIEAYAEQLKARLRNPNPAMQSNGAATQPAKTPAKAPAKAAAKSSAKSTKKPAVKKTPARAAKKTTHSGIPE